MNLPRFDHEKLNVHQASLEFISWATDLIAKVGGKAAVKDQLDRASTSIPLNIAEGNGKFAIRAIAVGFSASLAVRRWSALRAWMFWSRNTCAMEGQSPRGKGHLIKIVSMLMGLINSVSSRVGGEPGSYLFSGRARAGVRVRAWLEIH